MARIRTIKPEFFKHDKLAELPALARLLFIGLWTIADREGRLENRPKRIKAEVLPYDDANVDEMLKQLREYGFITCYEVDGRDYIQIDNFIKHQHVFPREQASIIPEPSKHDTRKIQVSDEYLPSKIQASDEQLPSNCPVTAQYLPSRVDSLIAGELDSLIAGGGGNARASAREDAPSTPPPPPPKNFEISAFKPSEEERLAWESLRSIPDYPADTGAFEHLRGLISEFPELNPVKVIRSWRDYLLTAKNGKAKACPSALRTQFATAEANPGLRGFRRSAGGKPAQRAAKALKPFEPDERLPTPMTLTPGIKAEFERAKERLRESVHPDSFESWIAPLEVLGMHGEELVCGVESLLQAQHIKSQWDVGLVELTGHPIRYVYLQPAGA